VGSALLRVVPGDSNVAHAEPIRRWVERSDTIIGPSSRLVIGRRRPITYARHDPKTRKHVPITVPPRRFVKVNSSSQKCRMSPKSERG
jgi:hypothetical protein